MASEKQPGAVEPSAGTKAEQSDEFDLIWGAAEIGRTLKLRTERQAFRMLEDGVIPAKKIGRLWCASRRALREHFGLAA